MAEQGYWNRFNPRVTRRRMLGASSAMGLGLAAASLIGCSSSKSAPAAQNAPTKLATAGATVEAGKERPGIPVVKGAPKPGGTLIQAATETFTQHDAHTAVSNSEWTIIGERGLEMDEWSGKIRPNIIESWEVTDPTHLVLKVRKGIKIENKPPWNGREFNAEDAVFNLIRTAGLTAKAENLPEANFQRASTLVGMTKAEATDANTVRVTMSAPTSTFFNGMTEIRSIWMPKGIVEAAPGFKDVQKFGAISAWKMSAEDKPGVQNVFEKRADYWRKDQPYFDKRIELSMPDKSTQLSAFISKQIAIFASPTAQDEKTIKAARPDALAYQYVNVNYMYFRPSMKVDFFKDFRVRRALLLAIDYKELMDGYYGVNGGAEYLAALHPSFVEGWNPDKVKALPGYNPATKDKDRAEAAKLLAASGHENGAGISIDLLNKVKADDRENSVRFQAQMQKLFPAMKMTLKQDPDSATFDKHQAGNEFQMISNDSTMFPDAVLEAYAHFHSKGSRNYGGFSEPALDSLVEKALAELDLEKRKGIIDTFQQKYVDEWVPNILLYAVPSKYFIQPNLGGFDTVVGPWSAGRATGYKMAQTYLV